MPDLKAVVIDYTNWRGKRRPCVIEPKDIKFGSSQWHRESQWLLVAVDLEIGAMREFAMSGIHSWTPHDE